MLHDDDRSPARVLVARVLMFLAAGALAAAGLAVSAREGGPPRPASGPAAAAAHAYSCPMHAEVSTAGPGACPICGMALVRGVLAEPGALPALLPSARPPVAGRATRHPASERPAADKPRAIPPGAIPIAASSPALGNTWLPESIPPARPGNLASNAAVGAPVRRSFATPLRAAAWLEAPGRVAAVVYRDELVGLRPGEHGTFTRAAVPGATIDVSLREDPPEDRDASTVLIRFDAGAVQAAAGRSAVDTTGWLELAERSREVLVVPESAVLRSGDGPYVLVAGATPGAFSRRSLETGRTLQGQVVVLSGLTDGDRIALGDAFFLDVEQRLLAHRQTDDQTNGNQEVTP